ncbi:hypothetical protein Daus18300_011244 [Diaporthe australafricana]|uniref:O-methyltransferase C-terminal domain-containing protein n=1 Tax=Diaporthe australafricana TaxID=127596 RepID=A0ABR3W795_9PEZI
MLNLALGPIDAMNALTGPEVCKLEVMRTLDALGVPQAVPLDAEISIRELAAGLGLEQSLLHRQLRFAFLLGMFHEPREGFVAHTNLSSALLDLSPYIKLRLSPLFIKGVQKVPDALKLSTADSVHIPCELADARGRNMWQMLEEDYLEGQGMKLFSAGMKSKMSASLGSSLGPYIQGFDWGSLGTGTVVDVGGGHGHIEMGLMIELPGLDFVVQDLPTNAEPAQALIDQHEAHDRVKFQPHDFFQPQPVQKAAPKAYMLSRVLHDWQDDDCVKILGPLLPAMETHSTKLFVCERVLPDRDDEVFNYVNSR